MKTEQNMFDVKSFAGFIHPSVLYLEKPGVLYAYLLTK